MLRRRPLYLLNQDIVQDAIEEHGKQGITLQELMVITKLNYAAIQQAAANLRNRERVRYKTINRKLHLYPNHTKA